MWSYIKIRPSSPSCQNIEEIRGGEGCNAVEVQGRMSNLKTPSAASLNRFVHNNGGTNRLGRVSSHRLSTGRRDIDGFGSQRLENISPTQQLESIDCCSSNTQSIGNHQLSTDRGDVDGCVSVRVISNQQKYVFIDDSSQHEDTFVDGSIGSVERYDSSFINSSVIVRTGGGRSYNKDIIADVFRRGLNGRDREKVMMKRTTDYYIDSVRNSASDSNIVGLVFESEGVAVVVEVSLPPIIPLSSSCDNERDLSREGAYI